MFPANATILGFASAPRMAWSYAEYPETVILPPVDRKIPPEVAVIAGPET